MQQNKNISNNMIEYIETFDPIGCHYISSLSKEEFKESFLAESSQGIEGQRINHGKNQMTNSDYIDWVRKQLTQLVAYYQKYGKSNRKIRYKYSQSSPNSGRIYPYDFGLQYVTTKMREYCYPKGMVEIDMQNAFVVLMYYIFLKNGANELDLGQLKYFLENRHECLDQWEITKYEFLAYLNRDYTPKEIGQDENKEDLKTLLILCRKWKQKILNANPKWKALAKPSSKNKYSSAFYHLMANEEEKCRRVIIDKILDGKKNKDKICIVPMHDGVFTNTEVSQATLDKINHVYEFELDMPLLRVDFKPLEKREVAENYITEKNKKDGEFHLSTYKEQKEKFETNHFKVKNPVSYWTTIPKEDSIWKDGVIVNGYYQVKKEDYKDDLITYHFHHVDTEKGTTRKVSLDDNSLDNYWADVNKRTYEGVDWIPHNNETQYNVDKNIYNMFQPFPTIKVSDKAITAPYPEFISLFLKLLNALCNHADTADYLLDYISHIIQRPAENPQVLLVLKGVLGGSGKDTLYLILKKLVGEANIDQGSNIKEMFGASSTENHIANKLILKFDEIDGEQGCGSMEAMKHFVTTDRVKKKEKHKASLSCSNYTRVIINSNNLNPIPSDRRVIICQINYNHLLTKEEFNRIYTLMEDSRCINVLYTFLLNRTIKTKNIREVREIGGTINKNKQLSKRKPIHIFIQRLVVEKFPNGEYPEDYKIGKKELVDKCISVAQKQWEEEGGKCPMESSIKKDINNWIKNEYCDIIRDNGNTKKIGNYRTWSLNLKALVPLLKDCKFWDHDKITISNSDYSESDSEDDMPTALDA